MKTNQNLAVLLKNPTKTSNAIDTPLDSILVGSFYSSKTLNGFKYFIMYI